MLQPFVVQLPNSRRGNSPCSLGPPTKLPGIEAATGSTILHFMHPHVMQIIDVRTIEVLFDAASALQNSLVLRKIRIWVWS